MLWAVRKGKYNSWALVLLQNCSAFPKAHTTGKQKGTHHQDTGDILHIHYIYYMLVIASQPRQGNWGRLEVNRSQHLQTGSRAWPAQSSLIHSQAHLLENTTVCSQVMKSLSGNPTAWGLCVQSWAAPRVLPTVHSHRGSYSTGQSHRSCCIHDNVECHKM